MENIVAFCWEVNNPFFPHHREETTFYSKFVNLCKWKLVLKPILRRINTWIFYLTITGVQPHEKGSILAQSVQVNILKDGILVESERREFFAFEENNQHTFQMQATVETPPRPETQCLIVKVEMRLDEGEPTQVDGFTTTALDQLRLSLDLFKILNEERFSNMKLLSRGGLKLFHVHSYVIDARWDNFIHEHNLWEKDFMHHQYTVETDISEDLLSDILFYMYSGVLPSNWPDWNDPAFATELFQVIERYNLHHLYQVFVKNDSQQLQVTQKDVFVGSLSFRLDDDIGRFLEGRSQTWRQDSSHQLDFRLEISRSDDGPCVSNSMQSRTPYPTQARVNMEFERHVVDRQTGAVLQQASVPLHVIDYHLEPFGFVSSEPLPLVGDNPIFEDFDPKEGRDRGRSEIRQYIRCHLNVSDGSSVVQVRNAEEDSVQTDSERLRALQDHMQALEYAPFDADFVIYCPDKYSGCPDLPPGYVHPLRDHSAHKAILITRVPAYWTVFRNVEVDGDIPDAVNCDFGTHAMEAILLYIYSGRILACPAPLARDMYEFAESSGFIALTITLLSLGFQGNQ